jgi:uncharacterized hydrophobic protein (TIGR00271 family)
MLRGKKAVVRPRISFYLENESVVSAMDARAAKMLKIEETISQQTLSEQMRDGSGPTFAFFTMLAFASAIATFGLITNSAPAIIGAMIIAPLMSPIIGLSFGAVIGDRNIVGQSIASIATGTALVVLIGYLATFVFDMRIAGSEILARTAPTTIDLAVALCAGGAGSFAHTRAKIANSIAGVAIAVALVPPLAVCGIGLALGDRAVADHGESLSEIGLTAGGFDIAIGAFVLFASNIVGIIGISVIVFVVEGYGSWRKAAVMLLALAGCTTLIYGSLDEKLFNLYVKNRFFRIADKLEESRPDLNSGRAIIETVRVWRKDGELQIHVFGMAPKYRAESRFAKSRLEEIRAIISDDVGEPVSLVIELIPVEFMRFEARPEKRGSEN